MEQGPEEAAEEGALESELVSKQSPGPEEAEVGVEKSRQEPV
jgi:hypothetical protein